MRICGFSTCVCLQVYSSASPLRLGPQREGLAFASDAASGCKPEFSQARAKKTMETSPVSPKYAQNELFAGRLTADQFQSASFNDTVGFRCPRQILWAFFGRPFLCFLCCFSC